jgi:integrase
MEKLQEKSNRGRRGIDLRQAMTQNARERTIAVEITFGELCRAYLAAQYDGCEMQLRKWIDAFGDRSAWSITTAELADALYALKNAGLANATVNRNASQIGSVFKWAIKERRIAPDGFVSPTLHLPRWDEPIHRVEFSPAEAKRLLDATHAVKDRRFAALVALLIDTGARRGEVLERVWADVDLQARTITAGHTKTGTPRVLLFSEATAALVARVWPESKRVGMLFESRRAPGKPVEFKKHWDEVTETIGRPDLRMHDLRHFRAKQMIQSGGSVAVAAQALGHSSLILHRRYGHLETRLTHLAVAASWDAR